MRTAEDLEEENRKLRLQLEQSVRGLEDLRASTERYSLAVRGSSDGLWDWQVQTDTIYYSPRFHELLGFADGELPGRLEAMTSRLHPDDREVTLGQFAEALSRGRGIDREVRFLCRDDEFRWFRLRSMAIPGGQRMAGFLSDITVAKRNETELAASAAETARAHARLVRAVDEQAEAKQRAEEAAQARTAFLATMSHEIRTPLNAVMGMTSLLLETPLAPDQREFVETARTSGRALLGVINDILDFSKLGSGRLDLERQPFDMRECLEDALELVAGAASAKGLELGLDLANAVPHWVTGDSARVRQILSNYLSNAVKFTSRGTIWLSVRPASASERTGYIEFAVRDTGIGISPQNLARLWQPFVQLDSTASRLYEGTGLGLAICRRLAEAMGGHTWAESTVGSGSTFVLALPAVLAPAPPSIPPLTGVRLIVVDPSEASRSCVEVALRGAGAEAWVFPNADEALHRLQAAQVQVNVAILDAESDPPQALLDCLERTPSGRPAVVTLGDLGRPGPVWPYLSRPVRSRALVRVLLPTLGRQVEAAEQVAQGPLAARYPLRILVAEDNPVNQRVALLLLEHLGYRADLAGNGREVLDALARQTYDLVLMDLRMPVMDGLETMRRIRSEWGDIRRPRVVALTASALPEERAAAIAAGMDGFVAKPVSIESFSGRHPGVIPCAGSAGYPWPNRLRLTPRQRP